MDTKKMDTEVVSLCKAINKIGGLKTYESCCGHEDRPFRIWFHVENMERLPVLLFNIDKCHVKMAKSWKCHVYTDCAMSPAKFYIEGPVGKQAYEEAGRIAKGILQSLKEGA